MRIRDMEPGEAETVLALVMRVFDELVRPDFTEAGIAEFTRTARSVVMDQPQGHEALVAESDGRVVGMIDVRDGSHISLFFVDADCRGRGVGRALVEEVARRIPEAPTRQTTVNSSPWAVPVYERLGFVGTAPLQEKDGIRYMPMAKVLG